MKQSMDLDGHADTRGHEEHSPTIVDRESMYEPLPFFVPDHLQSLEQTDNNYSSYAKSPSSTGYYAAYYSQPAQTQASATAAKSTA